jgi:hypothetical protein
LDGDYVPARYPSLSPYVIPAKVCTSQAADEAVVLAEEIVRFIATKLSSTNILQSYIAFVKAGWLESELRMEKN